MFPEEGDANEPITENNILQADKPARPAPCPVPCGPAGTGGGVLRAAADHAPSGERNLRSGWTGSEKELCPVPGAGEQRVSDAGGSGGQQVAEHGVRGKRNRVFPCDHL